MRLIRSRLWIAWGLALVLVVVGCGTPTPEADMQQSPLTQHSPLPTATIALTALPAPTLTPTTEPAPAFTPEPTPTPGQLLVLHSNDNWGETEPCG